MNGAFFGPAIPLFSATNATGVSPEWVNDSSGAVPISDSQGPLTTGFPCASSAI